MERKLKAELWDKMQYLFRDYNDRVIHIELRYDYKIDIEILKVVLNHLFHTIPILHSSFVYNGIKPYWKVKEYRIDEILTVKEVAADYLEEEINKFLMQPMLPEDVTQMKIAVLKYNDSSILCAIVNHMCMDGGDFKRFMNLLCRQYNDYAEHNIRPIALKEGTRSYESIYQDFTSADKRMVKKLYHNINTKDNHRFPFTSDDSNDRPFIVKRKLPSAMFDRMKEEGKRHGATLNDMILAAYFRVYYELARLDEKESCSISCAIDLRRYLKNKNNQEFANHTAWMQCYIPERGASLMETLKYVVQSSSQFKQDKFMGLHGLPLLSLCYKLLPYSVAEKVIKTGYSNPFLSMSNIGILEADKFTLAGHVPSDGFMSGSVKYKPYALLTVTSMRKEITISMCLRGNEEDKRIINQFFDLIIRELETV